MGFPIGGAVVMETGLFAASTLFMGLIGTAQLAAHQIALQLASIAFMVPLGLSHAATIRIGLAVGAGDWPRARLAGWVACGLGTAFMARHGDPVREHARHRWSACSSIPARRRVRPPTRSPSGSCASPPCSSWSTACR